jgi:hypothetical protein
VSQVTPTNATTVARDLRPMVGDAAASPETVSLRTLAVRPAAGAIQRPILPTLSSDSEEEPGR